MEKILVIDDEKDICTLLEHFLKKKGYDCKAVDDETYGFNLIKKNDYDLVITDLKLPTIDGIDLLQKIKELSPRTKVIIITGYSDVRTAVKAIRYGAFDYVSKPLYPDELLATVQKALASKEDIKKDTKASSASKTLNTKPDFEYVLGESQSSRKLFDNLNLVAPTDMSVMIIGETGTGKEYVAREIHNRSDRKNNRFFAVDCGALPKDIAGSEFFGHEKGAFTGALNSKDGYFKLAEGGTLFLDEIGNLSYEIQVKLLRVLQEKKYRKVGGGKDLETDVRILVATNEDLKKAVEKGDFRQDLYFRLNEFSLQVNPLRNRQEDIEMFARHFMKQANASLKKEVKEIDKDALSLIKNYEWQGNLRELKNVIKRAVLMATNNKISKACLPEEIVFSSFHSAHENETSLKSAAEQAEKETILKVLAETGNNKTKAAAILNIDRKTLYNKLKAYKN